MVLSHWTYQLTVMGGVMPTSSFSMLSAAKRGSIVISRHNKIRDELIHMAGKAMIPSAICDKPLI
jgi:hypothetical protein